MSDSTPLIQQIIAGANADVRVNENFDATSPSAIFGRRAAATTGLTWAYYGGRWPINGVPTAIANGTVTLTASTTNYIGITQAGVVTAGTTANPLHTPLYTVVTGASTVTSYIDHRGPMKPYGIGTQAMADANQTITQALALCDSLVTTGALTATRNLVVPLVRRAWTVRNNCTGGSVQVIGATGTGITIAVGAVAMVECDGTNVLASTTWAGGTLTSAINQAPAVTIASSTTPAIGAAAANSITITGTTTITGFDTIADGAVRVLTFSGILTLTHNATSLILPTGANITTAAGDVATFVSLGAGNWRCVGYMRASGAALAGGAGDVSTDAIWDAAGDLAVGSGADTAARLAKGTALQVLRVNAGETGLEWGAAPGAGREFLTAARTYYVRTDGSDSNDGLANTAGGAFLTVQKAADVATGSLDAGIYQVTVQIADGTYTGATLVKPMLGTLPLIFQGNNATPSNVHMNTTGSSFTVDNAATSIKVLDLKMSATSNCLLASPAGKIEYGNVVFGTATARHINCAYFGYIGAVSSYTITGGAVSHILASGGKVVAAGLTMTITGTPAFSGAFLSINRAGVVVILANTYTGSATGARYNIAANGVADTSGAATTVLPGDSVGTTETGGQYV